MLRTRGSRGADKMDVLTPVRAEECQPVASNDFLDLLWRTAKDELALVLGCAGVGYTQHAGKPEQPCENLSFHFAPHSYLQLGAETCGQGFAETIVEQPRWQNELHIQEPGLSSRCARRPQLSATNQQYAGISRCGMPDDAPSPLFADSSAKPRTKSVHSANSKCFMRFF